MTDLTIQSMVTANTKDSKVVSHHASTVPYGTTANGMPINSDQKTIPLSNRPAETVVARSPTAVAADISLRLLVLLEVASFTLLY